jgi:membrane protein DedA with SNARE-associated domain
LFEWITGIIERLGYLGVLALTFLENLFPPIPSEVVIPLAGFVAANGGLRLDGVIVAGTAGSLMGAALWYGVGRQIGERRLRAWVEHSGKWLTLSPNDLDRAQAWFTRHGRTAVLIGRVIPGVRTLVSLPAGFSRMPLVPFLLFSALGTLLWTAALAYAGVALRASYTVVGNYIDVITNVVLIAVAGVVVRRYIRCWRATR